MSGVNEQISAEQVTKELLEQQENMVNNDPTAVAATMYGMYLPHFKAGLKKLSSRARTRVLNALVEYPLNEKKYQHTSDLERELMSVGHAVLQAKFLMIMATYNDNLGLLADASNPEKEPDLTEEEKQELLEALNTAQPKEE